MNYSDALAQLRKEMDSDERVAISALVSLRDMWASASDSTRARWLHYWGREHAPEWLTGKLEDGR